MKQWDIFKAIHIVYDYSVQTTFFLNYRIKTNIVSVDVNMITIVAKMKLLLFCGTFLS